MSENISEDYESDYQAPMYSVVSEVQDGTDVIRQVIIDGELVEFRVSRELHQQQTMVGSGALAAELFGDEAL